MPIVLDDELRALQNFRERLLNNSTNSEYLENGHNFNRLHDVIPHDVMYRNPSKWEENTGILVIVFLVNVIVQIITWN